MVKWASEAVKIYVFEKYLTTWEKDHSKMSSLKCSYVHARYGLNNRLSVIVQ